MELREKKQIVQFEPTEIIPFKLTGNSQKSFSYLLIKNISDSQIAFKIKVSNQKSFEIDESQGFISSGSSKNIEILYHFSSESFNSINKILVIVCLSTSKNIQDVNWSEYSQEFKFWSSFKTKDPVSTVESDRDQKLSKNKYLKDKIEKYKRKLKESQDLNYLTHEKIGKFTLSEIVILFIVGFLLGVIYNFI